jgi:nucleoside-diphosphate-sugar epimerase
LLAAWNFWNQYKNEVSWDLTVLNPPYVYGPHIHDVNGPEGLGTSAKMWYDVVVEGAITDRKALTALGSGWVDVRDLAEAHVRALEREAAGGERIIIAAGAYIWQQWSKCSAVTEFWTSP